ncbi:hypothetical protein C8J57DRAFT_1287075 [Mycena rebaudengoi]|nr:hypothetical protein C8J57DRAFT_1287075 [Mycena rebaudengoi]
MPSLSKLQIAHKNEKELPDAPATLTPLRKHQPSPFFNRSHWSRDLAFTEQPLQPSHGRLRWIFTLPVLFITLLSFAMATIFLLYLVILSRVPNPGGFPGSAIFTSQFGTAPLLGLTLSTIATHIVSLSVPFLVSAAAYCVAWKWLADQEFPHPMRVAVPTPLQYGLIVKMLTVPSIGSVYQAGHYLRVWRGEIRFPRTFHLALALTSLILGLAYLLILADIWLHAASSVVQSTSTIPRVSFGVAFNESVCIGLPACLNGTQGWASGEPWVPQVGLRIASNSSDTSLSVITVNNASDLAIVVPKSTSFEAPSFGVRAQCVGLTPQIPLAMGNSTGRTNSTSANSTSPVQYSTNLTPAAGPMANPQGLQLQLSWTSNGTLPPANRLSTLMSNGDIVTLASCQLAFYNITFRHQDGQYSIGQLELSNSRFANILQGALFSQLGNLQLAKNYDSALAAVNQELGRITLALSAGTLQPTTFISQSPPINTLFGRYPLGPVIAYASLLYAYALTAGGLYIWAARLRSPLFRAAGHRTTSAAQLAQMRLTDPLALVATLFPAHTDDHYPMADDPRELFAEDEMTVRLEMGICDEASSTRPVFGVYKRARAWAGGENFEMRRCE